jgi:sulfide:quinone oxidoreductase
MSSSRPLRVLVAGGGVAGIETVLALQALAGERVAIELLAPGRHFTYRPLAVAEPFRPGSVQRVPLAAIAHDRGVALHRDALARVLPGERAVETQGGARIEYDALVLALGARPVEAVRGALTFRGTQDAGRVAEVVERLRDGALRRVAFVVPAGTGWALPLYELALQTAVAIGGRTRGAQLTLLTPEPTPLAAFGGDAAAVAAALLAERGIELHTGVTVDSCAGGRIWLGMQGWVEADCVIALPRLLGPRVRGVPADAEGFVPVDAFARVNGVAGVYAVGDVADHALKQGGLAAEQADVAACAIAAAAGAPVQPRPYRPALRGLLLTGGEPRYLRRDLGVADEPVWPPAKIMARHLAPYLDAQAAR